MIRHIALLLTVLALVLLLPAPARAAEPDVGVIQGQVVQGTEGGSSLGYGNVTLTTYLNDNEVASTTNVTDSEGGFRFDGLSTTAQFVYEVSVEHEGVEYKSEQVGFGTNETVKSANVTVYDTTTSDDAIRVVSAHTFISVEANSLVVVEYLLMANMANWTYVGSQVVDTQGDKGTLQFSLPQGATDLQPIEGLMDCCIISGGATLVDTMPVLPNTKEVAFSYTITPGSGTFTLSKEVYYPTTTFHLFVEDTGVKITSDQLTVLEPQTIQGIQYLHLSANYVPQGVTLEARISGLGNGGGGNGPLIWAVVGLSLVAIALASGYVVIRRRRQYVGPEPVSTESDLERQKQRLLLEIAQLDDDFESGGISEEVYRRMRSEKKTQLAELMRPRGKGSGGQ